MEAAEGKKKSRAAVFGARLFSTLCLWAVVMGVFLSGRLEALVVLVAVLGALGSVEFFRLTARISGRECLGWALLVSLGYLAVVTWEFLGGPGASGSSAGSFFPEITALGLVMIGCFVLRLKFEPVGPESIYPVAMGVLSLLYVPIMFAGFTIRLAYLPAEGAGDNAGAWLVLFVVLVTKFTDMGAYAVGSLIGKHKAIPHVSPAKSWEGYIGSLFFSIAGAYGVYFLGGENLSWIGSLVHVGILGVIISVAAMVGDLGESILKRSLHVKDSGQMLPGIGGVLDLVDSICFSVPIAFFYLILFVI